MTVCGAAVCADGNAVDAPLPLAQPVRVARAFCIQGPLLEWRQEEKPMHLRTFAAACLAIVMLSAQAQAQRQETWQERKDRENAATSAASITRNGGKWDAKAEAERKAEAQRRAAAQPLTGFTHCDQGYCYGTNGKAYARSGNDVLVAPDGKTCHRSGSAWYC